MAPKHKPISALGTVEHHSQGKWRATVRLAGKRQHGPLRVTEDLAFSDLWRARAAPSKTHMAAVLTRLKQEAETAREKVEARAARKHAAKLARQVEQAEQRARNKLARQN